MMSKLNFNITTQKKMKKLGRSFFHNNNFLKTQPVAKANWSSIPKFKTFATKNMVMNLNYGWICGAAALITTGLLIHEAKADGLMDWTPDNYKKVTITTMTNVIKTTLMSVENQIRTRG